MLPSANPASTSLRATLIPLPVCCWLVLAALATIWHRDAREALGRSVLKQRVLLAVQARPGALLVRVERAMVEADREHNKWKHDS